MIYAIILMVMFVPPIVFIITGVQEWKNKFLAKKYFIGAVAYLMIGLGTCGAILNSI